MKRTWRDHWDLTYKGVSIWAYYRGSYNQVKLTPYRINLGLSDDVLRVTSKLAFSKVLGIDLIVAVTKRESIKSIVSSLFLPERFLLIERGEKTNGNSTLIEGVWYLFRRLAWLVKYRDYREIQEELVRIDPNFSWNPRDTKDAIGDYFYNKFLRLIIPGRVIYTNCLIPKIERYMGCHDSWELQHGVIHESHFDYVEIPRDLIKNKLMVWDVKWKEKLVDFGYGGEIIPLPRRPTAQAKARDLNLTIFTTVSREFSSTIDRQEISLQEVAVQLHPRDYYKYNGHVTKYLNIVEGAEYRCAWAICHDTTLIFTFIDNGTFFFYLKNVDEKNDEIIVRLRKKYEACLNEHYAIINRPCEAADLIMSFRSNNASMRIR